VNPTVSTLSTLKIGRARGITFRRAFPNYHDTVIIIWEGDHPLYPYVSLTPANQTSSLQAKQQRDPTQTPKLHAPTLTVDRPIPNASATICNHQLKMASNLKSIEEGDDSVRADVPIPNESATNCNHQLKMASKPKSIEEGDDSVTVLELVSALRR
jgi:hypothetical protein